MGISLYLIMMRFVLAMLAQNILKRNHQLKAEEIAFLYRSPNRCVKLTRQSLT